ncbi:MAG: peptide-methionine (S)-S-oxide reductase, partial [Candidatus Dadabacteria bacterium]|nr:peptide-methionine (S)-S-oxide reductase [Candidatus Dadabacteria bacterium]
MGVSEDNYEKATFSGGCFWCMQPPFDRLEGVISTTVGYTGGL